jgi:hypothetical protein
MIFSVLRAGVNSTLVLILITGTQAGLSESYQNRLAI